MRESSIIDKPFLSVAMITFNEERIIERTLSAIQYLADEIIVIDSFSTDNTVNILKKFQVSLYQEQWKGYALQKNSAIRKCLNSLRFMFFIFWL